MPLVFVSERPGELLDDGLSRFQTDGKADQVRIDPVPAVTVKPMR